MTEEILIAGLGGFVGWVTAKVVSYFVLRNRLVCYLDCHISLHLANLKSDMEWLETKLDRGVQEGRLVGNAVFYTASNLNEFHTVRTETLKFLTRDELLALGRFVDQLFTIEALLQGICTTITQFREDATPLTSEDVERLQKRADRIRSIFNRLPTDGRLRSLPQDYSGVQPPGPIVADAKPVAESPLLEIPDTTAPNLPR